MTAEIIVDGVNVAGCHNKTPYKNDYGDVQCKCYRFEDIENNTFLFGICKQHPNCYYKQLQRLKQENEELKEENIKVKKEFNNLIVEIISDVEFTGEIASNGETPIEHLHKCQNALKTLEEIRKYINTLSSIDSDFVNTETYLRIVDKINEVLNIKDLGFWDKDGEYKEDLQVVDEKELNSGND